MAVSTIFYITLALLLALGFAFFQYLFKKPARNSRDFIFFSLRFISVFLVLLLLIDPMITSTFYEIEKPDLILLTDNSQSISYLDQEENIQEVVRTFSEDNELNNRFDLQRINFGREININDSLDFSARQTDLFTALWETEQMFNENPAAILLLTDGNQSLGRDYRYYEPDTQNSIYPVILGDTASYNDLSIQRINSNRYAFLNNQFPVEIFMNYSGDKDLEATINIRSGESVVYSENVSFSEGKRSSIINTVLPANSLGVKSYTVELVSEVEERNVNNNRQKFAIEVIDERTSVLILSDIPHPDLGAIKKAIESNQQRTGEIKYLRDGNFNINDYQLVIIYQLNRRFSNVISQIINRGHNYFIITGSETDWYYLNSLNLGFGRSATGQSQDVFPVYNPTFSNFQFEDIGFEDFPPLTDKFGPVEFQKINYNILLYQELQGVKTGEPLMAVSQDRPKRGFLLGENIWRWRAESYLKNKSFQEFDDFFSKLIQNLAAKRSRDRLTVDYENFYYSNEDLIITAQYFDENYQFDPGGELSIEIENNETKESFSSSLVLKNNFFQFNAGSLSPGTYNFKLKVENRNISKSGEFEVVEYSTEQQFVSANLSGMQSFANNNEVALFFPDQINSIKEELINNDKFKPVQKSRQKTVPLIDWYYLLFILIIVLAAEWLYRKYLGLI